MKKIRKFVILPLLFILLAALAFSLIFVIMRGNIEIYRDTDSISDAVQSLRPSVILLENVSAIPQPDGLSCGITTVTMMSNYYHHADLEATALIERYDTKGNSYDDMISALREEIPGRAVTLRTNATDEEMIRDIHASLNGSDPVMISFGSRNPYNEPYYDFHASVVYGMDLERETITIANAYGYSEEVSLVDFLNRMSYTETKKYPLFQQFVLVLTNMQNKNTYFLVD